MLDDPELVTQSLYHNRMEELMHESRYDSKVMTVHLKAR
jgi:hypothetical protein